MKLKVLMANEEALKHLVNLKLDNAQIAWDLADSLEVVDKAMKKFHEKRGDYIKANGKPNEKNPDNYDMDSPEDFQKEMVKLLEVNVKVEFPVITFDDLKGTKVSTQEMIAWKALGIVKPKK